jgi:hypothetical protein
MRRAVEMVLALALAAAARTSVVSPDDAFRDSLAALSPGDTLYLLPGTYTAGDTLPLLHVAPAQAGVTVTSSPEEPAVLDGQGFPRPVLFLEGGGAQTRIELVTVTGGAAESGQWFAGGGAFLSEASAILFACTFQDNAAVVGGAVAAEAGEPVIQRCEFLDNSSASTGGAVNLYACVAEVLDCSMLGNDCADDGGGLNGYQSTVTIRNTLMAGNQAGDDGGGLALLQGTQELSYLTLDSNSCVDDGAGILLSAVDYASLSSCIVTSNQGKHGIVGKGSPDVDFQCCCAWDNEMGNYFGWEDPTGTQGNISQDPLYADSLYRLSQTAAGQPVQSPCVDAGHEPAQGSWIEGYSTRTDSIPDSLTSDMGWHQPSTLQSGPGGGSSPPAGMSLFPSPFRDNLFIRSPAPGEEVSVRVYDSAGRLLWRRDAYTSRNRWSGMWAPSGEAGPGVVLVRLQSGGAVYTGKAVLLR